MQSEQLSTVDDFVTLQISDSGVSTETSKTVATKPYDPFAGIVFPKLCDVFDSLRQNNFLPLLALLSQKPDLDLRVLDRFGYSPVHYATTFGNIQALRVIYEKNPSSLGCLSQGWQTVLMLACMSGNQEVLHYISTKVSKMRLDDMDHWKLNPLAYCVRANNIPAFFYLLTQGAKFSTGFKDFVNNSMVHYCGMLDRPFFLQALDRLGTDFNVLGEKDLHPFHRCVEKWSIKTGLELIRMADDAAWRRVGLRILVGDPAKSGVDPKKLLVNAFPLPEYSEDALLDIQSEYIPAKIKELQTARRLFPEVYGVVAQSEEESTTVFGGENARLKAGGFLNTTCTKVWYATTILLSGTTYLSDHFMLTKPCKYLIAMFIVLLVSFFWINDPVIRMAFLALKIGILSGLMLGSHLPLRKSLSLVKKQRQESSLTDDEELGFNSKQKKQPNYDLSRYYLSESFYKVQNR